MPRSCVVLRRRRVPRPTRRSNRLYLVFSSIVTNCIMLPPGRAYSVSPSAVPCTVRPPCTHSHLHSPHSTRAYLHVIYTYSSAVSLMQNRTTPSRRHFSTLCVCRCMEGCRLAMGDVGANVNR